MDGRSVWRGLGAFVTVGVAACTTTATSTAPVETTSPDTIAPVPSTLPSPSPSTSAVPAPSPATEAPATTLESTTTAAPIPVAIDTCPPTGQSIWEQRQPSDIAAPPLSADWTVSSIGSSVRGRDLTLLTRAVADPSHRVLVVGGIHGNEPVSPPTVRGLVAADIPDGIEVLLVPEANPDGVAAGVRCNANGVDLNRNFPWGWRAETGGPGPLSEPETAALAALIQATTPDVVVWVHQPYGYVSSIGATADAYENAWAAGSGLPVRPDVTQHGGGESWTALDAARPSMLIEIDTWNDSPEIVASNRSGFEALLDALV